MEIRLFGQERVAQQETFGIGCEHDRPDVLAEVSTVSEVRALAGCGERIAVAVQVHRIQLGSPDRGDDVGVGAFDASDRATKEVAVALDARALGHIRRKCFS